MKRFLLWFLLPVIALGAVYFVIVLNWNYSEGERAGWVQKLSKKGWVCKTWEGELAMVSMPGSTPEKFYFTVRDEQVAEQINKAMGQRVALHYEQKVGLPTECFGETRYWVNNITVVQEIPLSPGVVVPVPQPNPAPQQMQPQTPAAPQPQALQPQPGAATK